MGEPLMAETFTPPEAYDATGKILDLMNALKRSLDLCDKCGQKKAAHVGETLVCPRIPGENGLKAGDPYG